jgi:hypothetical protein
VALFVYGFREMGFEPPKEVIERSNAYGSGANERSAGNEVGTVSPQAKKCPPNAVARRLSAKPGAGKRSSDIHPPYEGTMLSIAPTINKKAAFRRFFHFCCLTR